MYICAGCGKPLFTDKQSDKISFSEITSVYRGVDIYGERKLFCNIDCSNNYWDQYIEEEWHGCKIYRVMRRFNGRVQVAYTPYLDCPYYFVDLDACRNRIYNNNASIIF